MTMVVVFSCKNARKWQKKHIYRPANKKQGTADVFRSSNHYGKFRIAFLDCLKKEAR